VIRAKHICNPKVLRLSLHRVDTSILQHALIGYQAERIKIDQKIAEIEALLNGKQKSSANKRPLRKRRRLSAAARARIATAQKERWAKFRKQESEAPATKQVRKRVASPEVRKKRIAALAKARAAKAAKKAAA